MHRLRFALRPGWVLLHVVTLALVIAMTLLGHWQLDVSELKHFNIRNFGYALQWWAFSVFTLVMWWKIVRDRIRQDAGLAGLAGPAGPAGVRGTTAPTAAEEPVAYRRYVAPKPAPVEDETLSAYNDYLARLNAENGGAT